MADRLSLVASADEIATATRRLAAELSEALPGGFLAVGVLKGAVPFLADLVRLVTVPVDVDFLAVTPYGSGEGRVQLGHDLGSDITDRDVVLVEDIVDTGLTLAFLLRSLETRGPRSLRTCTLVDRQSARLVPVPVEHVGFTAGEGFLIGHGLDFAGRYRNAAGLWAADGVALAAEPDRHLLDLYPS